MKRKPVVPRTAANHDVDLAVSWYLQEGGEPLALRFIDALERAYGHVSRNPATGSTRYAHALDLPELRTWPVDGFPHLVFYVERDDHVDVWRVLHAERDIPARILER